MGLTFNNYYKNPSTNNLKSVDSKRLPSSNSLTNSNRLFLQSLGYNVIIRPNLRHLSKTTV